MRETNMLDKMYDKFQEELLYRMDEIEIQKARQHLIKAVNDPEKESVILDFGIAYERAGFRNGFIIATKIFAECMTTGTLSDSISIPDPLLPFKS